MPDVGRGSRLVLVQQVLQAAGLLVGVILLARLLGPEGRGLVSFVVATVLVAGQLAGLGLGPATLFALASRPGSRAQTLTGNALLAIAFGAVAAVAVGTLLIAVPALRPEGTTDAAVVALAGALAFEPLGSVGRQGLLGLGRFRRYLVGNVLAPWLFPGALAVSWAVGEFDATHAAILYAVVEAIGCLSLYALAADVTGLGRPARRELRATMAFGLRGYGGHAAHILNARADQTVMGAISTPHELGLYATAVNVAETLVYVPNAAGHAVAPAIAASDERSPLAALPAVRLALLVSGLLAVPVAAGGALLVPLVFGPEFRDAVPALLVLVPGYVAYGVLFISSNALVGSGLPSRASVAPVTALAVGLSLDLLLIPSFGAVGAAAAATAALAAGGCAGLVMLRRSGRFGVRDVLPGRADVAALRRLVPTSRAASR